MRWKDAVSQGMMMIQEGLSPLLSAISSRIDMAMSYICRLPGRIRKPPFPKDEGSGTVVKTETAADGV